MAKLATPPYYPPHANGKEVIFDFLNEIKHT